MFSNWIAARRAEDPGAGSMLPEFFRFMNEKVTLNKTLSTVFIEIWEIALYNGKVREKLQVAYREWIGVLSGILAPFTDDAAVSRRIAIATVAFLEGMALFRSFSMKIRSAFKRPLAGFRK